MKIKRLSRRDFQRAVREGRGSVFLHLASYGLKGRKKILMSALEENPCFCSITGGGYGSVRHEQPERVSWLLRLLDFCDLTGYCVDRIEELLKDKSWLASASDSVFGQVVLLSAYLFERGHVRFKPLLLKLATLSRVQKRPELIAGALVIVASFDGLDRIVKMLVESTAYCWQYGEAYQAFCLHVGDAKAVDEFVESKLSH